MDHGYYNGGPPADPRWDWVDVSTMAQPDQWIKGECRHLTPDPVLVDDPVTETRILVAWYCQDCDGQLKPERFEAEPDWTVWDEDFPAPNGFERWAYAPSAGLVLPPGATVTPVKDHWTVQVADRWWLSATRIWEWMKEHHWVGWVWAGSTLVLAAVTGQLEGWK